MTNAPSDSPSRPVAPIRGVAEIVLNVRDIHAMTAFYRDVLGFRPLREATDPNPTIVFLVIGPIERAFGDAHPQVLALIDPARHAYADGKFDMPVARSSTLNHLAFEIDTGAHAPALERLAGLGIEVVTDTFEFMRANAIFFKDPEGNTLELISHDPSIRPA